MLCTSRRVLVVGHIQHLQTPTRCLQLAHGDEAVVLPVFVGLAQKRERRARRVHRVLIVHLAPMEEDNSAFMGSSLPLTMTVSYQVLPACPHIDLKV